MRLAATWLMLLGLSLFAFGCQKTEEPGPAPPPAVGGTEEPAEGEAGEATETAEGEEAAEPTEGSTE